MTLKKLFILDSRFDHKELIEDLWGAQDKVIPVQIIQERRRTNEIPRGYEGYLLHLHDVDVSRDLPNLRDEQPWSWIYAICGQGTNEIISEVRTCIDRVYFNPKHYDYERMFSTMKQIRGEA